MQYPTQKEEVLRYLQEFGTITAFEGFTELFIVDLASNIRDLRKKYIIDDEWIHKNNRFGKPIRFKKYIYVGEKV